MPHVYVSRRIAPSALDLLRAACTVTIWDEDEQPVPRAILLHEVANADGLLAVLSERIDAELLDAAPKLRIVANYTVGYDNADVAELTRRGVMLTNTAGTLDATTADIAWALLLAAARRVVEGQQLIQAGGWRAWSPAFMVGQEVSGATLGVIGAGRIGEQVLRRAAGFDMPLRYHNRTPNPDLEARTGAEYRTLDALLQECDHIVVLTPLNDQTRGLIGAREFALMKPTAVFVNASRGPVINEGALYHALRAGRPWAAGLDVFEHEPIGADHPLLTLPNVVAIPHLGSATVATRERMAVTAARNLLAGLRGERPPNLVNDVAVG